MVITFGVDSPGVAPGKVNSYRHCAPVNNVPARLLVISKVSSFVFDEFLHFYHVFQRLSFFKDVLPHQFQKDYC